MGVSEIIMPFVQLYAPFISYLIGAISQETLIFLAVLSGAGSIPLWVVALFGFLGSLTHDSIMYYVGKRYLGKPIAKIFKHVESKEKWINKIVSKSHENVFMMLFLSKFIYGVRLAMIWYVSGKEKNYISFIKKDFPADACAFAVMLPIGWLAGRGFSFLLKILNIASDIALLAVAGVIILVLIRLVIRKIKHLKNTNHNRK